MIRLICTIVALLFAACSWAIDLRTTDGVVHTNFAIVSYGPAGVFISHDGGRGFIPVENLSPPDRVLLGCETSAKTNSISTVEAPATNAFPDRVRPVCSTNAATTTADAPIGETTATGKPIYVGPRGGRYHISASGNKVYEKHKK